MKQINFSKGYSVIELLIYIALFVMLSLVIMQSLLFTMKTYANARSYRTLQQNSGLVIERITREIRQASSVSVGGSTFGVSPGVLALTGTDSGGSAYTESIVINNGIIELTVNSVVSSLSSNEVTISNLTFWNITTPVSSAIKVKLTLTTTTAPVVTSTFYTTAILRN